MQVRQTIKTHSFTAILAVVLLAVGFAMTFAPPANALSGWKAFGSHNGIAKSTLIEVRYRRRGARFYPPIVPYIAYDYPYYYGRGYYPRHIGPGYIYHGFRHARRNRFSSTYKRQCSSWRAGCGAALRKIRSRR